MIEIGYFGIPGSKSYFTKTHITDDRRPICKAPIRRDAEFQMCSNGATHVRLVECGRCKRAWEKRTKTQ